MELVASVTASGGIIRDGGLMILLQDQDSFGKSAVLLSIVLYHYLEAAGKFLRALAAVIDY